MWTLLLAVAQAATVTVDPTGTGDATSIGDALLLLSDGDSLYIGPGTYYETDLDLSDLSDITVIGSGKDSTIIDASLSSEPSVGIRAGPGMILVDLSLTGFAVGINVGVSGDDFYGDVEISNCAIREIGTLGIQVAYDYGALNVHDCTFEGAESDDTTGIFLYAKAADVTFEDNIVAGLYCGVMVYGDSPLLGGDSTSFTHNTFVGITWWAFAISSECYTTSYMVVANNIFEDVNTAHYIRSCIVAEVYNNLLGSRVEHRGSATHPDSTVHDEVSGDPAFVAWTDDGDLSDDDLHLTSGSAAIDIGADGVSTSGEDMDGAARPLDGDCDGVAAPDAGTYELDAGCPVDTGVTDTGPTDTGPTDTGVTDTGVADTGVTDTSPPADSQVSDTTDSSDSAPTDSSAHDSRPSDSAGPTHPDASGDSGQPAPKGCGCNTKGTVPSPDSLVLVALLALRRRRSVPR